MTSPKGLLLTALQLLHDAVSMQAEVAVMDSMSLTCTVPIELQGVWGIEVHC